VGRASSWVTPRLTPSVGNQITANRIFGNTGQAIDLGDDGVTEDGTAPRQGPNNLQNFPILVMTADGQTEGWLGVVSRRRPTASTSSPAPPTGRVARVRLRTTWARWK